MYWTKNIAKKIIYWKVHVQFSATMSIKCVTKIQNITYEQ